MRPQNKVRPKLKSPHRSAVLRYPCHNPCRPESGASLMPVATTSSCRAKPVVSRFVANTRTLASDWTTSSSYHADSASASPVVNSVAAPPETCSSTVAASVNRSRRQSFRAAQRSTNPPRPSLPRRNRTSSVAIGSPVSSTATASEGRPEPTSPRTSPSCASKPPPAVARTCHETMPPAVTRSSSVCAPPASVAKSSYGQAARSQTSRPGCTSAASGEAALPGV